MKNCDVPIHLQANDNCSGKRISTRLAEGLRKPVQCPCCKDDQVSKTNPKHRRSASPTNPPQKRKRTSMVPAKSSSQPSSPVADHPEVLGLVPTARFPIDPANLPVASNVAPSSPQPSTAALQDDSPLMIHNHSVEDYQKIYHEVVDDMLRYKDGRLRPYSLKLGRRIKKKLWERLDRPTFTTSFTGYTPVCVSVSYGVGVCPPLFDVDISEEPKPVMLPQQKEFSTNTESGSTTANYDSESSFSSSSSSSPSTSSPHH